MQAKRNGTGGFTLVEMLVVVAVISILAAILIPSIGAAQKSAKNRKAELECTSIKTAVEEFYKDFHYMPWGKPNDNKSRAGDDQWAESAAEQKDVMAFLLGDNKLGKAYIEFSDAADGEKGVFYDPWKNPYRIGMDRNMDQQVGLGGKTYKARVLVYSLGPDGKDQTSGGADGDDIRTFDLAN